jgi:hypothetical protein
MMLDLHGYIMHPEKPHQYRQTPAIEDSSSTRIQKTREELPATRLETSGRAFALIAGNLRATSTTCGTQTRTLRSTTNAAAPRAWASSRISHARLESQRCTSSDAANDRYPLTMHARSWKNAATKFARHPLIPGVGGGVDIRAPLVQCCARRLSGSANT